MDALTFIHKYFPGWSVASVSTYGTIHGVMKLRRDETFIKIRFSLNGSKHWTDSCVTVNYVDTCEGMEM